MKKWISIFAGIILAITAARMIIQPGVVKKIGHWKITKSDIEYRTQVSKIYFPESNSEAALKQLEKSAQYLKVLEKNGITVTEEDLDKEEARILKQTQNPELLEKIKKVFGKDREAYRKNYVLPTLVDRFIYYDFFLNNPQVQIAAHDQAMSLIKAVQQEPENFDSQAQKLGLKVNTLVLGKSGIEISQDRLREFQNQSKGKLIDLTQSKNKMIFEKIKQDLKKSGDRQVTFWRDQLLAGMKEKQVFPSPVNQDDRLLVVYLEKKKSAREAIFKVVTIDKLNFEQWLQEQEGEK